MLKGATMLRCAICNNLLFEAHKKVQILTREGKIEFVHSGRCHYAWVCMNR